jgi:hypothetical protein
LSRRVPATTEQWGAASNPAEHTPKGALGWMTI